MLARKLLFKFAIVILVTKVNCQYDEYKSDSDDDDEEHSSYSEDSDDDSNHPDYSKYYNPESKSNKAQLSVPYNGGGGFVSPIEFQNFFAPGSFGFGSASSNQEVLKPPNSNQESSGFVRPDEFRSGFGSSDSFSPNYFEKTASSELDKPVVKNANFVSKPSSSKDEYDKTEVYDLNKKPKSGKYHKDNGKVKPTKAKLSSSYKANKFASPSKYNSYPAAPAYTPQYSPKYTKTPYEKYSFQPVSYLSSNPYNPSYSKYADSDYPPTPTYDYQPSEIVSQTLLAKDCKRIEKKLPKDVQGPSGRRVRREAMQCYICKDPSTGGNYEQCSYSSQTEPTQNSFEAGSVEKYSLSNGDRFRFKRYTQKNKEKASDISDVADQDPYEYVKSYSAPYHRVSKPEDAEEAEGEDKNDYYKSEEYGDSDEYRFGPEYFTDVDASKEEKSPSEIRSEKLVKDAESCKKVKQGSMTCVVCKNLKTGDNYEQCSYTSEPNEKKYAYVKEKKYNSNDDPGYDSEEGTDSTQTKPVYKEESPKTKSDRAAKPKRKRTRHPLDKGDFGNPRRVIEKRQDKPKGKLVEDDPYDILAHFTDDVEHQREGITAPESVDDEYHFKAFPEYASKESKTEETRVENPYFHDDSKAKQDVEEVLADFAKKNRSDCKKVLKKGMTCFLCVDKKGLQNEECMYVSESRPQGSHLAYHEVKEYKTPQQQPESAKSESKINAVTAQKDQLNAKRRKLPKKVTTTASSLPRGADSAGTTPAPPKTYTIRSKVPRQYRRKNNVPTTTSSTTEEPEVSESRRVQTKKSSVDEPEPTIKTPKEFDVHGTEGAFSSETKPVFSKKLGFSLPRFMLEKSPDQIEFEEFEKHG